MARSISATASDRNGTLRIMLPRTRGFTLLEVLIAVMVFAIVLAAASSVFYGALHLRNGIRSEWNPAHHVTKDARLYPVGSAHRRDGLRDCARGGQFGVLWRAPSPQRHQIGMEPCASCYQGREALPCWKCSSP